MKNPPAHEVILTRIQRNVATSNETKNLFALAEVSAALAELLTVLKIMAIPGDKVGGVVKTMRTSASLCREKQFKELIIRVADQIEEDLELMKL